MTTFAPSRVLPPPEPAVAAPVTGHRTRLLDPAWPFIVLTFGMPVAYLLGFSAIVWILPAFAFGIPMAMRRNLRLPGMILPFAALAVWILLSVVQLPSMTALPVFVYRWLIWVSGVACFVWLCNTTTRKVPTKRIVDMLAFLWIVLVGFGYVAIALPGVATPSLTQRVLPQSLLSSQFIYDLTVVRFAELQVFLTGSVPRPAAPMPYTNGWGSTLGLLIPFFILSWLTAPTFTRRAAGWLIALLAVVPIAVSTNRGMWFSIVVALVYFAIRRAILGDGRPVLVVGMVAGVALTLVLFTPVFDSMVKARLENTAASNDTRENVYKAAFDGAKASPLLGHGAPVTADSGPPVGTHGLVWYAMFAHGFPALGLLIVALGTLFMATMLARTPTALWAHICILIVITQIPYYGLLPQVMVVGIAAGICWRENHPEEAAVEVA